MRSVAYSSNNPCPQSEAFDNINLVKNFSMEDKEVKKYFRNADVKF